MLYAHSLERWRARERGRAGCVLCFCAASQEVERVCCEVTGTGGQAVQFGHSGSKAE